MPENAHRTGGADFVAALIGVGPKKMQKALPGSVAQVAHLHHRLAVGRVQVYRG